MVNPYRIGVIYQHVRKELIRIRCLINATTPYLNPFFGIELVLFSNPFDVLQLLFCDCPYTSEPMCVELSSLYELPDYSPMTCCQMVTRAAVSLIVVLYGKLTGTYQQLVRHHLSANSSASHAAHLLFSGRAAKHIGVNPMSSSWPRFVRHVLAVALIALAQCPVGEAAYRHSSTISAA
jgi:hypothetical protein